MCRLAVLSQRHEPFASGFQLTSAGFDSVKPFSVHTSVSELTHLLTVESLTAVRKQLWLHPTFKLYAGPPVFWQLVPDIIQAHVLIRASGVPREFQSKVILIYPIGWNIYVINLISNWLT